MKRLKKRGYSITNIFQDVRSWLFICYLCLQMIGCQSSLPTIQYSHNMRILRLPNITAPLSLIYRLRASPSSEIQHHFGVSSGSPDAQLLRIESVDFYQANVYLTKQLSHSEYNFTLFVSDGRDQTEFHCQIQVLETNKLTQSPFIHYLPLMSISENARFNDTVGVIHVKERDTSNLPVTFEIKGSENFGIRYIFGPKGTSKAEIFLRNRVDYEEKNLYRLQIYALNAYTNESIDTRNILVKDLVVTIINEQDTPPEFLHLPHLIELTEFTKPGDVIIRLHAIDGDHEVNRRIKYELRQDNALKDHFTVEADSGQLRLLSSIDQLVQVTGPRSLFTLRVAAIEQQNDDENNLVSPSSGRVLHGEHEHRVEHPHLLSGWSKEETELLDPAASELNKVESMENETEVIYKNKPIEIVELSEKSLQILDQSLSTEVNLAFIVLHQTNEPPSFRRIQEEFEGNDNLPFGREIQEVHGQISELATFGSVVQFDFEVFVQDADYGQNGTFLLHVQDPLNAFDVQPKQVYRNASVELRLLHPKKIKFEQLNQPNISIKIIASDLSASSLNAELLCIVSIKDANDHAPQFKGDHFQNGAYQLQINEAVVGLPKQLLQVLASDSDSGQLGQVTFLPLRGPLQNNLRIDPQSGWISLISLEGIDREKQDFYTMLIEVCDNQCKEDYQKNQTLLNVQIMDANDNAPQFAQNRYDFVLQSDLASFASPVRVFASDIDEPGSANSNVTYEIIAGNLQKQFRIDPKLGEITLEAPLSLSDGPINLDAEGLSSSSIQALFSPIVNLTVRAHDHGIPVLDSYVNVYFHHQNYVNRTVAFLLNQPEYVARRQKAQLEKQFSELTGGRLTIDSITESPSSSIEPSNRSWVLASIAYPTRSALNVGKLHRITTALTSGLSDDSDTLTENDSLLPSSTSSGRQPRTHPDVHLVRTSGLMEQNFIFWLLLVIILITLIFLCILIAIWCYFCGCRRNSSNNKIGSADSLSHYKRQQVRSSSQTRKLSDSARDAPLAQMRPLRQSSASGSLSLSGSGETHPIFVASPFPSVQQEAERTVAPQIIPPASYSMSEFDAVAYAAEMRRAKAARQHLQRQVSRDQDSLFDNKVVYATVKKNRVKFSEADKAFVSPHDEELEDEREEYEEFTPDDGRDQMASRQSQVGHLSEKHRSLSQLTLCSQFEQAPGYDYSTSFPPPPPPPPPPSSNQYGLEVRTAPNSILKNSGDGNNMARVPAISPTSDSDSGIGHQQALLQLQQKQAKSLQLVSDRLQLKNQHVAAPQSVFTIAYNGVKTERISSADSDRNVTYI